MVHYDAKNKGVVFLSILTLDIHLHFCFELSLPKLHCADVSSRVSNLDFFQPHCSVSKNLVPFSWKFTVGLCPRDVRSLGPSGFAASLDITSLRNNLDFRGLDDELEHFNSRLGTVCTDAVCRGASVLTRVLLCDVENLQFSLFNGTLNRQTSANFRPLHFRCWEASHVTFRKGSVSFFQEKYRTVIEVDVRRTCGGQNACCYAPNSPTVSNFANFPTYREIDRAPFMHKLEIRVEFIDAILRKSKRKAWFRGQKFWKYGKFFGDSWPAEKLFTVCREPVEFRFRSCSVLTDW